jgi:GTP-binding protein
MKITSAEFVTAAVDPSGYPGGRRPEIAFLGRSNVGKSSLINSLLNRRKLAQTSRTPGKTRTLNFFLVNNGFLFVDLPGYGYARISRTRQAEWGKVIEAYLSQRALLCACVLLVDLRHPPSPLDCRMKSWLDHYHRPTVIVGTKADKIGATARKKNLEILRRELPVADAQPLIAFSARAGIGKARLWSSLEEHLAGSAAGGGGLTRRPSSPAPPDCRRRRGQ